MPTDAAQPKTAEQITADVVAQLQRTPDPRLREVLTSLVKHLHGFVRDVSLTEAEWMAAIRFLTATGHMCSGHRQEFILLSDTLGVSMVVDLINHQRGTGATESTVFGPFHREGAPDLPSGGNIAPRDATGQPALITGRVLDTAGRPIANALLDVWQSDSTGLYDSQRPDAEELHMRGRFRTGPDGRFEIRTTRPVFYSIPTDGPVGNMLRATARTSWRPAHVHFVVSAAGYEPVTTHIFDDIDPYLESDAVFAVKRSLCCTFARNDQPYVLADGSAMPVPHVRADFDFVLAPK